MLLLEYGADETWFIKQAIYPKLSRSELERAAARLRSDKYTNWKFEYKQAATGSLFGYFLHSTFFYALISGINHQLLAIHRDEEEKNKMRK